jgi:HEAT repeat protein
LLFTFRLPWSELDFDKFVILLQGFDIRERFLSDYVLVPVRQLIFAIVVLRGSKEMNMNLEELSPSQLVDLFADKTIRNEAVRALIGGLTAGELRRVRVSDEAKAALIAGLKHSNSKVRWWCVQLMDHIADESYLAPLLEAAQTDPTPKNRRHAIHALACPVCKPNRQRLNVDIRAELEAIAQNDSDATVREMAAEELAEILAD